MAPTVFLSLTVSHRGLTAFARRGPPDVAVCLRDEQDLSTVAELSMTMARAITLGDADLVVDLSRVEFMSASTVTVIAAARELLLARSRSLVVRSPSRCARRVLELCDLSDLIDSLPEALVAGRVYHQPGERLPRTTAVRTRRRAPRGCSPSGSPEADPDPDRVGMPREVGVRAGAPPATDNLAGWPGGT
jgi:anti-anti-sigma factor